jgi:NAD(P)-dependent dehydrogenase (short-subunit alcohol dehydrogenase family)
MADSNSPVAIVTGGARGIGLSAAEIFLRDGYDVVLADIDLAAANEAAERLATGERRAIGVQTDVSQRASVDALVETVIGEFGRIDVLVNNAGIAGRAAPIHEVTEEEWDTLMAIDLKSIYLCTRAVLPHMIERGKGAIVNVASVAGKEGNPNMTPYSTAKAGVIGFTKAVAKEVATYGIRVNCVCPATILTRASYDHMERTGQSLADFEEEQALLHPIGRVGRPREVAYPVVFLASDEASYITGTHLMVDGGYTSV